MTAISTAIGSERRSRTAGYKIKKGFFDNVTSNLPQLVAVFGEANTANQAGLSISKKEITSAKEAAELYGYGSPLHQMFRILRPISGDGIGGIPTIAFPQVSDVSASATVIEWTIAGSATSNATHTLAVAGRESLDFKTYEYTVSTGDTEAVVASKMADAINGVLSSPVSATSALGVLTITSKWEGETSSKLKIRVDNLGNPAGLTYAQTGLVAGAGTVDISTALSQFGGDWYTIVLNSYGENSTILTLLEQINGKPDESNPTGRYAGRIFKPFVALFGTSEDDKDNLALITDDAARVSQVTNVLCPAPKSECLFSEIAADAVLKVARIAQDTPELSYSGKSYADTPVPNDGLIGDMSDYNNRDFLIKKGCSNVILENSAYQIQELVTTYHPAGEEPLQYNYVRNLILDWNVTDGYRVLEELFVKDAVLLENGQVTTASKSIKPKQWAAILYDYFDALATRGFIRDAEFSKSSLQVQIDPSNPNRFNTFFRYRRTGIARIQSTDVEAGF